MFLFLNQSVCCYFSLYIFKNNGLSESYKIFLYLIKSSYIDLDILLEFAIILSKFEIILSKFNNILFITISLDDENEQIEKFLKSFKEFNNEDFIKIWDKEQRISD